MKNWAQGWYQLVYKHRNNYLWILPALSFVIFFSIYPMIFSFTITMYDYRLNSSVTPFIGLNNFRKLLYDSYYHNSLKLGLLFLAISVPLEIAVGLLFALLLNQKLRFQGIFRTIFIIPWVISMVATGLIMRWIFDDISGIANYLLELIGLNPIPWMSSSIMAFITVVIATTWRIFPFGMVILLAALKAIPVEIYESSQIDGASRCEQFRHITLPMLKSQLAILFILRSLWAFTMVDMVMTMTGGGPERSTDILAFHMYTEAFTYGNLSYGATMGITVFIILILLTLAYLRVLRTEG